MMDSDYVFVEDPDFCEIHLEEVFEYDNDILNMAEPPFDYKKQMNAYEKEVADNYENGILTLAEPPFYIPENDELPKGIKKLGNSFQAWDDESYIGLFPSVELAKEAMVRYLKWKTTHKKHISSFRPQEIFI
jgi:hypothetical protein